MRKIFVKVFSLLVAMVLLAAYVQKPNQLEAANIYTNFGGELVSGQQITVNFKDNVKQGYSFNNQGGNVFFKIEGVSTSKDYIVEIYDSGFSLVDSFNSYNRADCNFENFYDPGKYYVVIYNSDYSTVTSNTLKMTVTYVSYIHPSFDFGESNDISEYANLIQFNQTVTSKFSSYSDVDWFKFNSDNPGNTYLRFKGLTKGINAVIYDSEFTEIGRFEINYFNESDGNETLEINVDQGDNYIKLIPKNTSESIDSVNYSLTINYPKNSVSYDTNFEPNDSLNNAYNVVSGKTYNSNLDDITDRDCYVIEHTKNGEISVALPFIDGDVKVTLEDQFFNEITHKSTGDSYSSEYEHNTPFVISESVPKGKYYVIVTPNEWETLRVSSTYQINVTANTNNVLYDMNFEPNNTEGNAFPITSFKKYDASFNSPVDADYYLINSNKDGDVEIDITDLKAGCNATVLDFYGNELDNESIDQSDLEYTNEIKLTNSFKKGKYVVKIFPNQWGSMTTTSTYSLKAKFNADVVAVDGVKFEKPSINLPINKVTKLSAIVTPISASDKSVIWESSNKNVLTVDQDGNIRGVSKGQATISVMTKDGDFSSSLEVNVTVPVDGILFDKSNIKLNLGQNYQVKASIKPADAFEKGIIWKSSNPQVISVSSNGLIKAIGVGNAYVTATTKDGGHVAKIVVSVPGKYVALTKNEAKRILKKTDDILDKMLVSVLQSPNNLPVGEYEFYDSILPEVIRYNASHSTYINLLSEVVSSKVKQPYLVLCDSKTREQIFGDYSVRLNLTKINKNQYQATFVQRRGYVGYINARLVKNYVVKINFVFENNKWKLSNLTRTQANLNLTKEEAARAIIDDDIGNRNVKYLKTIKKTSSHLVFYFTGSSFGQKTIFKVDNLTGEVSD